jgi:alpha-beta hydrolase superfamily lysophospholipase
MLVPAFGEEGECARRTFHETATALAARGFPVASPDLTGTSNSGVDMMTVRLEDWVRDLQCSADALHRLGAAPTVLVGLRFGAVLAVKTLRLLPEVRLVCLWEPLADPERHFRQLLRTRLIRESLIHGRPTGTRSEILASGNERGFVDLEGFPISVRLVEELQELSWSGLRPISGRSVRFAIAALRRDDRMEQVQKAIGATIPDSTCEVFFSRPVTPFWARLGPVECPTLVDATVRWIEAHCPEAKLEAAPESAAAGDPDRDAASRSVRFRRSLTVPVEFTLSGKRALRAYWHGSPNPTDRGIVLLHGASGHSIGPHRLLVEFAQFAASAGWHVLRFDFGGRGVSGGNTRNASLDTMMEDALCACETFVRRASLGWMALLGLCSGAKVALASSGRVQADALALWSPENLSTAGIRERSHQMAEHLRHYGRKLMMPSTWRRLVERDIDGRSIGRVLRAPLGYRLPRESMGPAGPFCHRSAMAELSRRAMPGSRVAPTFLAFAEGDPAARSAAEYFQDRLVASGRKHRVLWIARTNHNFYSVDARRLLIQETAAFLQREAGLLIAEPRESA